MKCQGIENQNLCFDCPYGDCLVDLNGNLPDDEEQIRCILSLKRKEKDKRYYDSHHGEIIARRKTEAYREIERKASAKYRKKHKKQISESNKRYRKAHPEEIKAAKQRYREKHREQERERNRRYYAKHREEILARRRACVHTNKNQGVSTALSQTACLTEMDGSLEDCG